MSTPRWKKEQRQNELMAQAARRKREKSLTMPTTATNNSTLTQFKEYFFPEPVRRDEGIEYKSLNSGHHNTSKVPDKVYTGTLVKGIGTMHKSNAVPILSQQDAIDIATMRRN